MPDKNTSPQVRPLSDRRYLRRGPAIPYRGTEVFLLLLDLAVIFFGIKVTEMIYSRAKGDGLIAEERATQEKAREQESLMIATRTAKRDSLKLAEEEILAARAADSLRMADLDTTFNLLVAAIEQGSVAVQAKREEMEKARKKEKSVRNAHPRLEGQIKGARLKADGVEGRIATLEDSIKIAQADVGVAEQELAIALAKRPEVVVPKTSNATVGATVSDGAVYSTVGLGHSFVNFGRTQLGLNAGAGFGPDNSTVSGGGLFWNVPVIPNRASLDIGTGAAFLTENEGGSDASPYLSGSLRYALKQGKRFYLLGDTRVSHDQLWTGVGLSFGR